MRKIIHRVDDKISQPSLNVKDLSLEIKHDPDNVVQEPLLTTNTFDFEHSNAHQINNLISENGINEGIKYSMSIKENGSELMILDSYLVVNGSGVTYSCDKITGLQTELRGKNDSVVRRSKEIVFSQLLEEGFFTTDEYVQVPYINSSIPDYKGAAITSITAFIVLDKLVVMVKEIVKIIADIGGVLSALAGVLKIVVVVIWIIITLATLIIFMFQILDLLIQPVKYHAGMRWKRLLEIGCEKLGYTFESSIFEDPFINDTVILPAKFQSFDDDDKLISFGFTTPEETRTNGYYAGSFFDLLVDTKETFRAYISVTSDNRLIIEKIGAPTDQPSFKMNPKIKMDEWRTNAEEIIGNYGVKFQQDPSDNNTYQNHEGTVTLAITKRTQIKDGKTDLIDGQKEVNIPFARASKKTELTRVEKLADRLTKQYLVQIKEVEKAVKIANNLKNIYVPRIKNIISKLKIVGINIPFTPQVTPDIPPVDEFVFENRIDMMIIEDDFFTVPKVLALDIKPDPKNTKIKDDNQSKWHSDYIYDTYHAGQSHAPSDQFPFGGQRRIFKALEPSTCKEDLLLVINNSSIFAPNGQSSKLVSFKHKIYNSSSEIEYMVPYLSDPYLITTKVTTTGL